MSRKIDALIAERVMGLGPSDWVPCERDPECGALESSFLDPEEYKAVLEGKINNDPWIIIRLDNEKHPCTVNQNGYYSAVKFYSQDMRYALEIINYFISQNYTWTIQYQPHVEFPYWETHVSLARGFRTPLGDNGHGKGVTLPMSICIAALSAIGMSEEEINKELK